MKLQIEITTRCNLSCKHCVRSFCRIEERKMNVQKFKSIVDSFDADRIILYGYGEPLLHEDLKDLLRIANTRAETLIVTNATLNFKKIADYVDILGVSINSASVLRSKLNDVEEASKHADVWISTILTKDNISELFDIVSLASEIDVNVIATNLNPYNKNLYEQALFVELSERPVDECLKHFNSPEDIEKFLAEVSKLDQNSLELYNQMLEEIGKYHLNVSGVAERWERIKTAKKVKITFERVKELAESLGVSLDLPKLFADELERACPYEDAVFVRVDGKIVPCSEFAYTHPMFVNRHSKLVVEQTLNEVFDKKRKNLVKNFPWCGDCQFADICWFVEENRDCYGNEPSCSECLASVGIVRCLL